MFKNAFDRIEALAARHSRLVSILSGLFFIASCADNAGLIKLPKPDWMEGWPMIAAAAIWNALWWGFGFPRVQARRAARLAEKY